MRTRPAKLLFWLDFDDRAAKVRVPVALVGRKRERTRVMVRLGLAKPMPFLGGALALLALAPALAGPLAGPAAASPTPTGPTSAAPAAPPADSLPWQTIRAVVAARSREGARTDVRVLSVGAGAGDVSARTWATLRHPADGVVRGDLDVRDGVLRGVAVVADEEGPTGDYRAALSWVTDKSVRRLSAGVLHASRPLVDDGQIFVERGAPGPTPMGPDARRALREDNLEIDAVDPVSGTSRVVATWNGYAMHLAGAHRSELVVYRVGPRGAEIVAIDRGAGRTRVLRAVPPFARDFSIDSTRGVLVFQNRDEHDAQRWTVEQLDLASGATTRLSETHRDAQTPFAHVSGRVFASAPGRRGLGEAGAPHPFVAPFGAGYTYVTDALPSGVWLALAHVPNERGFDRVGLYAPSTRRLVDLTSAAERIDVIGLLGGADERRSARGDTLR